MNTNDELVDYLIKNGVLSTPRIIDAFRIADRGKFVLREYANEAYADGPLPIGFGQTISQPTTVAFMLELLQVREGEEVLDVGSGSGWTTALLAQLTGPGGSVTGVEIYESLVELGRSHLRPFNFPNAEILRAQKHLGIPGRSFDKILVSASASQLPSALMDQLKPGGRMVIPVLESVFAIDKLPDGKIVQEEHFGFVFVPLQTA